MKLDCVEILRCLVGYPTVSRDSNLSLVDWARNYLADQRIESHLVPNADGTKANLFATVGPSAPGGLVLSGHTDVVPVRHRCIRRGRERCSFAVPDGDGVEERFLRCSERL